jgi:UDP-glucuronate 4-epimerase
MKVLVTGAAGFIGSTVAGMLLDEGHAVTGIDNFNDYYDPSLKEARHRRLEGREGYRGFRHDLCDYGTLLRIVRDERIERVVHLAAQPGVRYSIDHPFAYQKANLEAFLNVLEACRHGGVERLVYASSSSVYGGNTKVPFREDDPVDRPVSLYAATKKANELMAHTYTHLYGFRTVGLRFFTVYGPWGRPDMAYWLFTDALLAGRPIKVFHHGRMRRDFTWIEDIRAGILRSLVAESLDPCEVINLGNHRSENLMDMIRILADACGVEPKMEMLPMQPGDVETTYADIERARRKLNYEPTTPIEVGLPRFVEWYRGFVSSSGGGRP